MPFLRCFHPHAEAQVAFGTPGHVPAAAVRALAADLEYMLAALAVSDDVILVRRMPSAEHIHALAAIGLPTPTPVLAPIDGRILPRKHALRDRLDMGPAPWAWTPDTCAFFAPFKRRHRVPTWSAASRPPWSKAFAARHFAAIHAAIHAAIDDPSRLLCGSADIPRAVADVAAARSAMTALRPVADLAVVKAPFSTAGRGAMRFSTDAPRLSASEQGWLTRNVSDREVVVAPWRTRLADVSVQLDVDRLDTADLDPVLGVTGLSCDAHGRYRGNDVHAPADVYGCHGLLRDVGRRVAAILREHGHRGPAGIDAMVFHDPVVDAPRVQPLLEINPRHTMGHLALGLRRFLAPSSVGRLLVVGPRDRITTSLPELYAALDAALPTERVDGGRIRQAAVALNDPAAAAAHLALFIAAPSARDIDKALAMVELNDRVG